MTTTRRTIRIDDTTWTRWHEAAQAQGVSRSVFIRDAVNARLNGHAVMLASDIVVETLGVGEWPEPRPNPPLKTKRNPTSKRSIDSSSGMCEHRVKADAYCANCAKETT